MKKMIALALMVACLGFSVGCPKKADTTPKKDPAATTPAATTPAAPAPVTP